MSVAYAEPDATVAMIVASTCQSHPKKERGRDTSVNDVQTAVCLFEDRRWRGVAQITHMLFYGKWPRVE